MNVSSNPFTVSINPASLVSPDGTVATAPGGSVITAEGTWTFGTATAVGGNSLLLNGVQAAGGFGHEYHIVSGKLYTFTANNLWYLWSGGSWANVPSPV